MEIIKKLFKSKKPLVGMIHLPPLLTIQGFPGLKQCINKALQDLEALEKAGFDAVLIENDEDKPHTEFANPAQISNFAIIAYEISKVAKIPIGVQVMINDWKSSIAIAKLVGAKFIRIDVFVDKVTSKWGKIIPKTKDIIDFKNNLYPELILLTDIQVKHKTMIEKKPLIDSAREAISWGTNVIIISGKATGEETPIYKIKEVKAYFPQFPVWVGAGLNRNNIVNQFIFADGAIVGTSIKTGDKIDYSKARDLINIRNSNVLN